MLVSILYGYFCPINVFTWQKSHFVDKYVQNANFSKWQKSNLHRALRGRTITAPHKSIEYIGLHMTIFLHNHTKMKLFTHWFVEIRSGTLLSSIYSSMKKTSTEWRSISPIIKRPAYENPLLILNCATSQFGISLK